MTADAPIAPLDSDAEILCPLCEYNLRGLIEPRCPECGHRSTWEELRSRPPQHPYLFEHHPKHNIWSFIWTVFGTLRPVNFWRSVKPAMPLRTRRLLVFGLICLFFALIGSAFGTVNEIVQVSQRNAVLRKQFTPAGWPPAVVTRIVQQYGSFQAYRDRVVFPPMSSRQFWINIWRLQLFGSRNALASCRVAAMALLWMPLTFLSLLIFRASMRQARIRTGHVLRCVLYTAAPICFYGIYLIAVSVYVATYSVRGSADFTTIAFAAFLLFLAIRLMFAYWLYLRFHQAVATVIASQIIVALALLKINLLFLGL